MNRQFLIILTAIITTLSGCTGHEPKTNPVVTLENEWYFRTGDSLIWANPAFPVDDWQKIATDKIWEQQGFDPYDGFAWYRTAFFLPSSIQEHSDLQDSLRIYLGKINNFDQTFLNGELIGVNGENSRPDRVDDSSFIHAPTIFWDKVRRYTLAADDPRIHWNEINVLAVRVYDEGGQGGIYTGNQTVGMATPEEYLVTDLAENQFEYIDGAWRRQFKIKNISKSYHLKGNLIVSGTGKIDNHKTEMIHEHLKLLPDQEMIFEVEIPDGGQSVRTEFRFEFDKSKRYYSFVSETPYILTPPAPEHPEINGARVYGVRPGHPVIYQVAASGSRPLIYRADLPGGLVIDSLSGIITGKLKSRGEYKIPVWVSNRFGTAHDTIVFMAGDRIALTPPMGWNSWNVWGLEVDEEKVIAAAGEFTRHRLNDFGWSFINIDDGWEIPENEPDQRYPDGTIRTNDKFPDMKRLADRLHSMGYKFGIYSSPGPYTCGRYTGSWNHECRDAETYAEWGVDYLKYDWCTYEDKVSDHELPTLQKPYRVMRRCLDRVDRDIVFSICQYGMGEVWKWGEEVGGNLWRTTGDITDTWESMSGIGFSQALLAPYAGPGHWNDPDMLVVGWVGWGNNQHPTRLTPDEQYTHITLWSMLSAPLLLGCDPERLDPFTLNLLTNPEVIAINQDPLGKQAVRAIESDTVQVWVKSLQNGDHAIAFFNLSDHRIDYSLKPDTSLQMPGKGLLRDLWRRKDLGSINDTMNVVLPAHGTQLFRITSED
ncbi:MAG: hypothetical protein Kow00127_06270 [Bacteroidales bacterium]